MSQIRKTILWDEGAEGVNLDELITYVQEKLPHVPSEVAGRLLIPEDKVAEYARRLALIRIHPGRGEGIGPASTSWRGALREQKVSAGQEVTGGGV